MVQLSLWKRSIWMPSNSSWVILLCHNESIKKWSNLDTSYRTIQKHSNVTGISSSFQLGQVNANESNVLSLSSSFFAPVLSCWREKGSGSDCDAVWFCSRRMRTVKSKVGSFNAILPNFLCDMNDMKAMCWAAGLPARTGVHSNLHRGTSRHPSHNFLSHVHKTRTV